MRDLRIASTWRHKRNHDDAAITDIWRRSSDHVDMVRILYFSGMAASMPADELTSNFEFVARPPVLALQQKSEPEPAGKPMQQIAAGQKLPAKQKSKSAPRKRVTADDL